jgi:adenylate cyclase
MRIAYSFGGKDTTFTTDKPTILIGRAKAGLVIDLDLTPDKTISRPHAAISVEGSRHWIEDLNSGRGTRLNGEEIKGMGRRRVEPGDTIQIGDTTLVIEAIETAAPATWTAEATNQGLGDITQTLDAQGSLFEGKEGPSADMGRRLALLYDLPLQLSIEARLDTVLQAIVERLVAAIPRATRGALLVKDPASGQLLLKAHVPAGEPAVSLSLARQAMQQRQGFVWHRGTDPDVTMTLGGQQITTAMYAPLLWKDDALGVLCAVNYERLDAFTTDDLRLMLALAQYAAMAVVQRVMSDELRANTHLMTRLLTNFSPKVRERLMASARTGRMRLGGQKSEVTILIADIRDFTRLTAGMDSEDVVDMLNDYFGPLVDVVFRFDGTLDKFIGDAMLVIFGSPEADPQQHEKAVRAALAMQAVVREVSDKRSARGQVPCDMGIGLHCGEVLHGFIGSSERMEFTVIGEAVNRAARYCDGAEAGEILISAQVHQWVWRIVQSEPVTITVKHEGPLPALRLRGMKGAAPPAEAPPA